MNFRSFFSPPQHSTSADLALLFTRLVAGAAFMLHGWGKIQHPFNWMDPQAFAPAPLQALAALSEFGGGLALILGLLTPLGAFGIACTMAVAFGMHTFMRGDPFVSTGGPSSEPAAVYFCLAVLFIALGPGRFSLDAKLFGPRSR